MINFFLPIIALAANASLTFSQPPSNIPVGSTFKISVNVFSAGIPTLGTDAVITYDNKMLEVVKIDPGNAYPLVPDNLLDIDNVMGKSRFSGTVDLGKPIPAEGAMGYVYFRAEKEGSTQINFDWRPGATNDSNIVPNTTELDLLQQTPQPIVVNIRQASQKEKLISTLQWIFSFEYLNF